MRCNDRKDRHLVDCADDQFTVERRRVQGAVADSHVRHGFPIEIAGIFEHDVSAHRCQCVENSGAGRIDADLAKREIAARCYRRGSDEERGAGKIGWDADVLGYEYSWVELDRFTVKKDAAAETAQHKLGV